MRKAVEKCEGFGPDGQGGVMAIVTEEDDWESKCRRQMEQMAWRKSGELSSSL